jgi:hypothetical protein
MNDEKINIAIAESLGWKNCKVLPKPQKYWDVSNVPEMVRIGSPPVAGSCTFPDYCNTLNAIHEAEKNVFGSSTLWVDFMEHLCDATGAVNTSMVDAMVIIIQATARQRAEAFLRTVGKWEE